MFRIKVPMMPKRKTSKKRKPGKVSVTDLLSATAPDSIDVLHRVLGFKHFLSSGFEPKISDAEILVCFADVRGFTTFCRNLQRDMQDRKIQNFLRCFFRIFVEGLMEQMDQIRNEDDPEYANVVATVQRHLVPTMYKGLGDGMMLVWELPPSLDASLQGTLTHQILLLIEKIGGRFYHYFRDLSPVEMDSFSKEVTKLDIGFGVAKGHAWRLDFGSFVDYAGSIINLASRLEAESRPRGVTAQYDVSPWLFDMQVNEKNGRILDLKDIKGYDSVVKVWQNTSGGFDQERLTKKKRGKRPISK